MEQLSLLSLIHDTYYFTDQVIQREPWEHIKDEDITKTAASFLGEIWQVPPMFSAIKVTDLANSQSHLFIST